jgi:hypothetical protein
MNKLNQLTSVIAGVAFLFLASCKTKPVNVKDNFEGKELSPIWTWERMEKRSFEIQSNVVRSGKSAAEITLQTGDTHEDNVVADEQPTERDELMEAHSLVAVEEKTYEYKFSMFIPDTFPVVPVRLVIAQWKEYCGSDSCSNDSPVVALRYVSDTLEITLQTAPHNQITMYKRGDVRNHWLDFDFITKFTRNDDGILIASINGEKVVDYSGKTSYSQTRGYHLNPNRYYFKMGLYRDVMPQPMSIYIDDYSKREIIR